MVNDVIRTALALDFGGTKLTAGLVDLDTGQVIDHLLRPTPQAQGAQAGLDAMIEAGTQLIGHHRALEGRLKGVGISFGGPLSADRRTVLRSMHVASWEGIPLPDLVSKAFGLPAIMDNDANLAALGEWHYGIGRGTRHMIYVQISTGIGAGLILDGNLYHGAGLAGELGHLTVLEGGPLCSCGKRGCLESVAAGWAIARDGQTVLRDTHPRSPLSVARRANAAITAKFVLDAARDGDEQAHAVVSRAATYLGIGISNTINLLAPDLVVIGGGIAKAEDVLREPVNRAVAEHVLPALRDRSRVCFWTLGDETTLIGAGALVEQMDS